MDFLSWCPVSPDGPYLFCYLPHHLILLLAIIYLPNERGGVVRWMIDSYKLLQTPCAKGHLTGEALGYLTLTLPRGVFNLLAAWGFG